MIYRFHLKVDKHATYDDITGQCRFQEGFNGVIYVNHDMTRLDIEFLLYDWKYVRKRNTFIPKSSDMNKDANKIMPIIRVDNASKDVKVALKVICLTDFRTGYVEDVGK